MNLKRISALIIILLALVSVSNAQYQLKPNSTPTLNKYGMFVKGDTAFSGVKLVPEYYFQAKKTMNLSTFGDTTNTFYAAGQYLYVKFFVRDTANSKVDSFYVETKDTAATLTAEQWVKIGAKNLLTGLIETIIVPGDGLKVEYLILAPAVGTVRIRRINTSYKTKVPSFTNFVGSN